MRTSPAPASTSASRTIRSCSSHVAVTSSGGGGPPASDRNAVASCMGWFSQSNLGSSHETRKLGPLTVRMGSRSSTHAPFGTAAIVTADGSPSADSIASVSP
jgi:hypothetical protein